VSPTITRFLTYFLIGSSTFVFDLLLLALLVEVFFVSHIIAAAGAFLIAVSIHYILSRRYVFKSTLRSVGGGYANFIGIALIGMSMVTGGMYVLVDMVGVHFLVARVAIAAVTGFWNYLMNLYVNFKVAGKHETL
jgi:putative flippase GtrA